MPGEAGANGAGAILIRLEFAARRIPELPSAERFAADHETCGWFWCLTKDASSLRLDDLRRALHRTNELGIDPSSWNAAELMNAYRLQEAYHDEKPEIRQYYERLRRARVRSPRLKAAHDDHVDRVRRLLDVATGIRPDHPGAGRSPDLVARRTLGQAYGTRVDARGLAALLCLFGADGTLASVDRRLQHQKLAIVR